jgi:hypothetical protein
MGQDETLMAVGPPNELGFSVLIADMTTHGMMGQAGVFFNYEISPMKVIHTETRQSFAHFLTSYVVLLSVPQYLTVAPALSSEVY